MSVFVSCSNGSDSSGGGGTPTPPVPVSCSITFSVDGGNGTLKATVGGTEINSGDKVEQGKTIVFTATPDSGFRVKGWTLDGNPVNGTNSSYSFTVTKTAEVKVSFESNSTPLPQYAVNFSVEGANGTLKAKADGVPETETSPINVEKGKTVTFRANPDSGYKVKEWKADDVAVPGNTTNSYAFTVTKAADVKVSFEALSPGEASYTVKHYQEGTDGTYPAEPTESETLHGTADDSVAFTPKIGGDYEGFTYNPALTEINGTVQENGTIAADGSTVVKLYYERNTVNVTFKLAGGNIAGNTDDVVKSGKYGTALEVPADPVKEDSVFKGWNPALPATPVFPAANAEYTANWALLYTINFGVDGANGTLTAKVDGTGIGSGNKVEQGKTVVFTAKPDTNFAVDKWTNRGSDIIEAGANETYNHTVTANANIKVKFKYAGANLTLDKRDVTKNKGETFLYRLVTAGSGSYTAVPEQADIITLDTSNLNSHGNIKITFSKAGATRIKVTDTLSGQTDFSGTITVKPSAFIPDYFAEAGVRYHVTDKTALKVSVTAHTSSGNFTAYTGTTLAIPKEVIHDGETYTVTDIEAPFKWGDTLQSVTVADDNTYLSSVDGVIFNGDKSILRWYPKGKPGASYTVPLSVKTLATDSFGGVSALQTISPPDGLKRIEQEAINNCRNVQNLTLPDSLEYLGFYALGGIAITSLTVPQRITEISGIQDCSQLQTVDLPPQLTKLGWACFASCGALTTVTCRAATPPTIEASDHVFEGTPISSATLKVPAGTEGDYRTAEGWKDFGTITAITP
ncbi:leucine-rich repeat protein [Treponema sp. Marseille-Q4523]|uniref:InlB B-repeat-containing protein n=1 Tax=Treponema sp. Marseille-Q4523 TaxID=2810610 RepID=UPI001961C01C|nr:leucine-rich repeat protein [Treponema sp. Marseille-Q4523]MBM7024051.1 leucine-rich repeat domain-containing protein [Treponema sp. Marseille-Q4523]